MNKTKSMVQQYTNIQDLPTLNDNGKIEHFPMSHESFAPDNLGKFISQNHIPPNQSGMGVPQYGGYESIGNMYGGYGSPIGNGNIKMSGSYGGYSHEDFFNPPENYTPPPNVPGNCMSVADHTANCPVCSKLYKCDKTLYVLFIIVLAALCAILVKKVMDL
jgi:hypothetical protein